MKSWPTETIWVHTKNTVKTQQYIFVPKTKKKTFKKIKILSHFVLSRDDIVCSNKSIQFADQYNQSWDF